LSKISGEDQKVISTDLRIFNDYGIRFIILGIWRERNRLGQYNGDLIDRMKEIPVDPWEDKDLLKIAEKGSKILNIEFDDKTINKIAEVSYQSVGVFQELCKELCLANDINEVQKEKKKVFDHETLSLAIQQEVVDYGERHIMAIKAFVKKNTKRKESLVSMSYYIAKSIAEIKIDKFDSGINRDRIEKYVQSNLKSGNKYNKGELVRFLNNLSDYQHIRKIWPPLFDYDQTSQILRIIDSTFFFYLKHAKAKILDEIEESLL
jgi:hypothetical protein